MIRMKIAFVLRLTDDYSGQCITKKKFVFSVGGRVLHPIEKEEGLYVFLEPLEDETRVWIDGNDYYSCSVLVCKKDLDPMNPILDVRLYGKIGKCFPYSCEYLTGTLDKNTGKFPLEVYTKRKRPTGLVLKEYRVGEDGQWLFFQGFTKERLTGKTYILGNGRTAVTFVLTEKRGINEYRIELISGDPAALKAGDALERIYRSVTDAYGAYAIPVESGEEDSIQEVMILHHTLPS